jgi:hypothetical protein
MESTPRAGQPVQLKLRTRIVAWAYICIHVAGFLASWLMPADWEDASYTTANDLIGWAICTAIPIVCWIGLLNHRIWGWRLLMITFTLSGLFFYPIPVGYMIGVLLFGDLLLRLPEAVIPGMLMYALLIFIPMITLLTDRPSGWRNPGG